MSPLFKDIQDKLLVLLPLIDITKDEKHVIFYYPDIEYDSSYDYITMCGDYNLIKKLMDRIIVIINNDLKYLDLDFEKDVFPQLIKELRKEKLENILKK